MNANNLKAKTRTMTLLGLNALAYMKTIIQRLVRAHPLLVVLLVIASVISITSLKPDVYFLGWDSFASYLDIPRNLTRSLFSIWRAYRGLGVESDSEIVDVFHLLFLLPFSWIVSVNLLDQIYLLVCLWLGIIFMYMFAYSLYIYIFSKSSKLWSYAGLFAFLSTFFYLFNLNTLSVFYFPILPYTARFFTIPLVHLALLYGIKKELKLNRYTVGLILLLFFSTTSYITATVFITMLLSIGLFALAFVRHYKKVAVLITLFLVINMFWLLPFIHYSVTKSKIIPFASSNIEGNEALLNKAASFFSPEKQMVFSPTFFEMTYLDPITNAPHGFHPLTKNYSTFPYTAILYIFPILYLAGAGLIGIAFLIFVVQKYRHTFIHHKVSELFTFDVDTNKYLLLAWIPIHMFIFLFLAFKQYSFLGFLYEFLSNTIPLFAVVFRFGDTKFHPFIVISASLSAAFALVWLLNIFIPKLSLYTTKLFRKSRQHTLFTEDLSSKKHIPFFRAGVLLFVCLITLFAFRTYFTGQFVGSFMYTKIPQAYFDIANVINQDTQESRVLHLPFGRYGYWRPYAWGYVGSSFLHNLIDKSYIDKTFEPASMENTYVDNKIQSLQKDLYTQKDKPNNELNIAKQTQTLYTFLQDIGVKYILLDETINPYVLVRGEKNWEKVDFPQSKFALDMLDKYGHVKKRLDYKINPYDYSVLPLSETKKVISQDVSLPQHIMLYEVLNPTPKVTFAKTGLYIDPHLPYLAQTDLYPTQDKSVLVQVPNKTSSYTMFPFQRKDATPLQDKQTVSYQLPNTSLQQGVYQVATNIEPSDTSSYLVKVSAIHTQDSVNITLSEVVAPQIQNHTFERQIKQIKFALPSNTTTEQIDTTTLRVRVDESVLSIPKDTSSKNVELGYVLVRSNPFTITLLAKNDRKLLSPSLFLTTQDPDCLSKKLTGYRPYVEGFENSIRLESKNGSVCVQGKIDKVLDSTLPYGELNVNVQSEGTDLDKVFLPSLPDTSKMEQAIYSLQKPSIAYLCVQHEGSSPCYNLYRFFSIDGNTHITLPILQQIEDTKGLRFVFGLSTTSYQEEKATLSSMYLDTFEEIDTQEAEIDSYPLLDTTMYFKQDSPTQNFTLTLPKTISSASSYNTPSKFDLTFADTPCEDPQGERTLRLMQDMFVSFTKHCGNGVFLTNNAISRDLYLWLFDYNLLSGQYPVIRIYDMFNEYAYERSSLYQGYPSVPDFKTLNPYDATLTARKIQAKQTHIGSFVLSPGESLDNNKDKIFSFSQYSENDGAILMKSFDVVALPASWSNLSIKLVQNTPTTTFNPLSVFETKKIFPFLWKVVLPKGAKAGRYLLIFHEGYDNDWKLLGYKDENHYTCNGLFNCYEINIQKNLPQDKTLYLFYDPAKLSFLGIAITLLLIVVFIAILLKRKTR